MAAGYKARVRDLENLIERILADAVDDPVIPPAIRQIDRVRSAAIAVLEAKLSVVDEVDMLGRLLAVAKEAELPFLAAGALLEEIRPVDERPLDPRPYSLRARQLRRAGYSRCPVCHIDVLDESTLSRLEREDREWLAEMERLAERTERLRGGGAA